MCLLLKKNIVKLIIKIHFPKVLAIFLILFLFSSITAKSVEFYEVERPYRKSLDGEYQYNIDAKENTNEYIDLDNVQKVYIKHKNDLYAKERNTKIQNEKDKEEERRNDRKKIDQIYEESTEKKGKSENTETTIEKKKTHKSWIEEWLPKSDTKPMELLGEYLNFKVWLTWPMSTNISAKETSGYTDNYHTTQLFTGKAKYYLLPAIFISAGNDRFKWWRWEIELGYIPLLAKNTGNLVTSSETSGYTFKINNKDLSVHLLTLSLNNFLQHDFFNKKLVGFVGLGIGIGYAWSMGTTLSSDFVMPIITGHLGISFMVGKKSKMNIAYTMMYSQMRLPNKYSFNRYNQYGADGSNRAIQSGTLKFSQILINGISIEYLFYTA